MHKDKEIYPLTASQIDSTIDSTWEGQVWLKLLMNWKLIH